MIQNQANRTIKTPHKYPINLRSPSQPNNQTKTAMKPPQLSVLTTQLLSYWFLFDPEGWRTLPTRKICDVSSDRPLA
jgi:hypothetical protein